MSFPAARFSPPRSASTRSRTDSFEGDRRAVRGTDSPTFARLLEERDDVAKRRAGSEDGFDPRPFQLGHVILGDDPTARDNDVAGLAALQQLDDRGEQGHVRAAQT